MHRYRVWEIREMFLDAEDADEARDIFANDPEGGNAEMGVEYMGDAPRTKLQRCIGTELGIPLFDQPNTMALLSCPLDAIHAEGVRHLTGL